jgi:opacity protein-like surface antigen
MRAFDKTRCATLQTIGILLLATSVSAQESNRWNPSFVYGATSFVDSEPHRTLGATFRIKLTNRLSVEPEFRYMSLPSYEWSSSRGSGKRTHSDILVAGHLVYDFRDGATKRVIPYVMGGVGWLQVRNEYRFTPTVVEGAVPVFPTPSPPQPTTNKDTFDAWWFGGTFGVRIMISSGFFVSPEVRLGNAESNWTASAVIKMGYGF